MVPHPLTNHGTQRIALHVNSDNVTYFNSFKVEHSSKETKNFRGNKKITINIFRTRTYDSIMCGYFCIGYIDFMLRSKNLLEYTSLFSPGEYEKNDKIILKYFSINY